jgi:hypothetical protein
MSAAPDFRNREKADACRAPYQFLSRENWRSLKKLKEVMAI